MELNAKNRKLNTVQFYFALPKVIMIIMRITGMEIVVVVVFCSHFYEYVSDRVKIGVKF